MTIYIIPTKPAAQEFSTVINYVAYTLRLTFNDCGDGAGGWVLDIFDQAGNPLLCGTPLVPRVDLLAAYAYLGIGVKLFVYTPAALDAAPTYEGLGTDSLLCYEV